MLTEIQPRSVVEMLARLWNAQAAAEDYFQNSEERLTVFVVLRASRLLSLPAFFSGSKEAWPPVGMLLERFLRVAD